MERFKELALNRHNIHGECNRIIQRTCRVFNERYPNLPPMNATKFRRITTNFLRYGKIISQRTRTNPVTGDDINETNVLAYFNAYPERSIRSASNDLGLTYSSIQVLLKKHKMHNYLLRTVQNLIPGDDLRRIEFCENILVKVQEDPLFLSKIIWTDEAKFSREGIVNLRNSHHWAVENPHLKRDAKFQHHFSFNVFCLLMGNKYSYFIYNENLNSARYIDILRGVVTKYLEELPLNILRDCWYQMDGAPAHSTREIDRELTETFEDRWIGRNGPLRWPPRSPDLTPLDFFLWGYIKSVVYEKPIQTKEELEGKVRAAFRQLNAEYVFKACTEEVYRRINCCLQENGNHIEHL